jgi:cytochrome c
MNYFSRFAALASVVSAMFIAPTVSADAALAQSNGCTACHQLEKKVIGPGYGQVSACYASKDAKKLADNKAALMKHVIEGGAGVWGQIPMPAHPQLKDGAKNAELVKIIDWVMKDVKATECPKDFKAKS